MYRSHKLVTLTTAKFFWWKYGLTRYTKNEYRITLGRGHYHPQIFRVLPLVMNFHGFFDFLTLSMAHHCGLSLLQSPVSFSADINTLGGGVALCSTGQPIPCGVFYSAIAFAPRFIRLAVSVQLCDHVWSLILKQSNGNYFD